MHKAELYLQRALLIFPVFLIFFFLPNWNANFAANGYLPRAYGMMLFSALSFFLLFIVKTNGQSVLGFFRLKKPVAWIWLLLVYCLWVVLSNALAPLGGFGMLGVPVLGYGGLEIVLGLLLIPVYSQFRLKTHLLKVLSISCLIILAISILESIGFRPLKYVVRGVGLVYPVATISIRQHLAGWFLIFLGASIFFWRNQKSDFYFYAMLFSGLFGVAICKNSGATLAAVISLATWSLHLAQKKNFGKIPLLALGIFILSAIGLPNGLTAVGQALNLSAYETKDYRSTVTLQTRFLLWKAAFNAATKRPLAGWGDETFSFELFNNLSPEDGNRLIRLELGIPNNYKIIRSGPEIYYYPPNQPKLVKHSNLIYIRAHSVLFDEMYSHGFMGLALLISLIFGIVFFIPKNHRAIFLISFCGYPISLLALFYVPSITPIFTILVGLAMADLKLSPLRRVANNE